MNRQNPYFTTKNLETNCKLRGSDNIITQGINTANPSLFPIYVTPAAQAVPVSCPAPAGLSQSSPAFEAALLLAIPTQPACKHFPVRGLAFISQKFQAHWQVVGQRQQDGLL